MAKVFVHGVGIQFYRGIGEEAQLIGPFSDLNFFIGANNAGKSIVLNFIHERLPFKDGGKGEVFEVGSAEIYRGDAGGEFLASVGMPSEEVIRVLCVAGFGPKDERLDVIPRAQLIDLYPFSICD